MDDETFLREFENLTLPFDQWHHRAHLRMAYIYLLKFPPEIAMEKARAGIKAYNAANKVPEGPERGYHETMTQAWLRLVQLTLNEFGPSETADAFLDKHTQLSEKRALLLFYSRDLIMSPRAKAGFVEPDLAPLPKSRKG